MKDKATLSVNETDLHFGGTVSFSYSAPGIDPGQVALRMRLYQGDKLVEDVGGWPITPDRIGTSVYPFALGSTGQYHSGASDGIAELYDESSRQHKVLASATFSVAA